MRVAWVPALAPLGWDDTLESPPNVFPGQAPPKPSAEPGPRAASTTSATAGTNRTR